jgi:hypothetical protein
MGVSFRSECGIGLAVTSGKPPTLKSGRPSGLLGGIPEEEVDVSLSLKISAFACAFHNPTIGNAQNNSAGSQGGGVLLGSRQKQRYAFFVRIHK